MSAEGGAKPAGSDGSEGSASAQVGPPTGRTAWARNLAAPVRDFLKTETGGAAVLLWAAVAALLWANSPWAGSYESVWTTKLSIRLGDAGISQDLRHWVNEGLMTFFFLILGLEAKRELDMGQLRERRRITIPFTAAAGGMALPVLIYLAFNTGGSGADSDGDTPDRAATDFSCGVAGTPLRPAREARCAPASDGELARARVPGGGVAD
jgi:hypothetical protein